MDRGTAAPDPTAAGGQPEDPESSAGVGDADAADTADFRAADAATASAASECSDGRRAGPGGQPYRGDITGAVLDSE
eukprot:7757045-Alexandrium_andersonii.AAC.1